MVGRSIGLDAGIEGHPPQVHLKIGAAGLADLAAKILARRRTEPDLDHLDLDLPSVALAIDDIRSRVSTEVETDFDRITEHLARPVEVIAYFLAMLELARWGLVAAHQEHLESAIRLRHVKDAGEDLVSEWGL